MKRPRSHGERPSAPPAPARGLRLRGAARILLPVLVVAAIVALPGCGGKELKLPSDSAGTPLFEQGQAALEEEEWRDAVDAFDTLLKNYPASPHLPDARVGLGRAYFAIGREDTLVLAIDAFQNFLTYHPTHPHVDYAQYMVGMCYVRRMRSPDRDQSHTESAIEAFQVFLEDYPDSQYVDEARERLQEAIDHRVRHEIHVARWQVEHGEPAAARDRALYALRNFPETSLQCDLKFILAESFRRLGEWGSASRRYEEILESHPDCEYAADARERLQERSPSAGVP